MNKDVWICPMPVSGDLDVYIVVVGVERFYSMSRDILRSIIIKH